jgi:hypothetical protein
MLHDRNTKVAASFRSILISGGIKPITLPARSPNLNAFAERWVRSAKQECLLKLILFGEASLRRAVSDFIDHFHTERNHQGKGNLLLFPAAAEKRSRRGRAVYLQRNALVACSNTTAALHELLIRSSLLARRSASKDPTNGEPIGGPSRTINSELSEPHRLRRPSFEVTDP